MKTGLGIVHSNHLETLADALVEWCRREPLSPLEEEVVLVQSPGMADWLKLRQAHSRGITAGVRYPLPARFLGELYQMIPGLAKAPGDIDPYDKDSLQWRIFKLLPDLLGDPDFERPRAFLCGTEDTPDPVRHFQLARRLADLFDQYQLYRSRWLLDWEAGRRCTLVNDLGQSPDKSTAFSRDEAWQMKLWQALVADIGPEHRSRAHLHQDLEKALENTALSGLPRRIFLFGINSLPAQLLQTLYLLADHCQLIMLVLNPCEEFWELPSPDEPLTHPLLDAWGARGRDFARLLRVEYDRQPESKKLNVSEGQAFPAPEAGNMETDDTRSNDGIPTRLQRAMQFNEPPPPLPEPLPDKPQVFFHPAYSVQREVEVLHDRLLDLFAADESLDYRDVVVMVPDIETYAAHIEAVFNRYPHRAAGADGHSARERRRLEFSIADRNALTGHALFEALEWLLNLPQARFAASELLALMEQPAIAARFGLDEAGVEQLKKWMDEAHIRWGLDPAHKAQILGAETAADSWLGNTWRQGLDRLLAGYCAGSAPVWGQTDTLPVIDGLAIDEVTDKPAALLGRLIKMLDLLDHWRKELARQARPPHAAEENSGWDVLFSRLLDDFFVMRNEADAAIIHAMKRALNDWLADCENAGLAQPLTLAQARSGWLDKMETSGASQRLSFNGITFCTLVPMRALPFRHVFLLGMNDGDFPREQIAPDFDLMDGHCLAGDRDRRGDDQYLFLEALLSVRDSLTISWVGKSIADGSEREPSTLVSQLRDYIDACWQTDSAESASRALTREWPLAPFSRAYFEQAGHAGEPEPPRTHALEWRAMHAKRPQHRDVAEPLPLPVDLESVAIDQLIELIKTPARVFFRDSLNVYLPRVEDEDDDEEAFEASNLDLWSVRNTLLKSLEDNLPIQQWATIRSGTLPAGYFGEKALLQTADEAAQIHEQTELMRAGATPLAPQTVEVEIRAGGIHSQLRGHLSNLWEKPGGENIQVMTTASGIWKGNYRPDQLAETWISHLAACAMGIPVTSFLVGKDKSISFEALDPDAAVTELNSIFAVYIEARQSPLPLAPKAGAAFIKIKNNSGGNASNLPNDALAKAKNSARKGFKSKKEHNQFGDDQKPETIRAFKDFDELWGDDGAAFRHWANKLYAPMLDAALAGDRGNK